MSDMVYGNRTMEKIYSDWLVLFGLVIKLKGPFSVFFGKTGLHMTVSSSKS